MPNSSTARAVAAIDVGGITVKAAMIGTDGRPLITDRTPTPLGGGSDAIVALVAAIVTDLRAAVPEVAPGIVDEKNGMAVLSANLGWRDLPLRDLVRDAVNLPVAFGHDVRAGGLAEQRLGAARGYRHSIVVPVGTGIAAALMLDGRPYAGTGAAGELGHFVVERDGPWCGCGKRGCLETLASASAIARQFGERSGRPAGGATEVAAAVRAGDPVARQVWDEALMLLAGALATVTTLLAPEAIVIGGGLAQAGDLVLNSLNDHLAAQLTFEQMPDVRIASLGDEAGCLGAGLLALDLLAGAPS